MKRIRNLAALTIVAALALSGVAAASISVIGGTTQLALSQAATKALSNNHLTVSTLAPTSASGSTYTLPISHGRLRTKSLHGVIHLRGGFTISNGSRTVRFRHLEVLSAKHGVWLFALVSSPKANNASKTFPGKLPSVHAIGHITGIKVANATATATVRVTRFAARGLKALAGKSMVKPGGVIGTITVTPKLG